MSEYKYRLIHRGNICRIIIIILTFILMWKIVGNVTQYYTEQAKHKLNIIIQQGEQQLNNTGYQSALSEYDMNIIKGVIKDEMQRRTKHTKSTNR